MTPRPGAIVASRWPSGAHTGQGGTNDVRPRDPDAARRLLELAGRGEPTHDEGLLAGTRLAIGEHGSVRGERGTLLQRGVTLRPRQEPGGSVGSGDVQVRWPTSAHRPRVGIEARYRDHDPLTVPWRRGLGPWDGGRRRRGDEPNEPEGHQGEHRGADEARRDPLVPPLAIAPRQDAFEGIRLRLEALDTGPQQLSYIAHGLTSKASRSDERARCRRTRTLAGLMPSTSAASCVSMPSQSTRISASR